MREYPNPTKELVESATSKVEFNGHIYTKGSDNRYHSSYDNKMHLLHRDVWIYYNGEIPKGYHIHHIDRNPTNNDISNLMCVSPEDHAKIHSDLLTDEERLWSRDNLIENAGPKAVEWHKSEDGHKWHTSNTIHQHEIGAFTHDLICDYCGKHYIGKIYGENYPHFCSGRCKTAYRRHSGVDDEPRTCQYCGKTFMANKRKGTKTCSKDCRYKLLAITLSNKS